MPSHVLDFQPWLSWSSGTNPPWWKSYNNVKHERGKYFRDANLGNVLESAAGLLVLLVYFYQPELYDKSASIRPDFEMMRVESKYAGISRTQLSCFTGRRDPVLYVFRGSVARRQ